MLRNRLNSIEFKLQGARLKTIISILIFLIPTLVFANTRLCSASWNNEIPAGRETNCSPVQSINGAAPQYPDPDYINEHLSTRQECLAYCDVECTMPDTVTLCVQRSANQVIKKCRSKNFFEDFGYPIPKTTNNCSNISLD